MRSLLIGISKVLYSLIILGISVFASRYFNIIDYALFREFFLYLNIGIGISGVPAVNAIYFFTNRNFFDICLIFLLSIIIPFIIFIILNIFVDFNVLMIIAIGIVSGIEYLLLDALFLSKNKLKYSFILTVLESISFIIPIIILLFAGGTLKNYFNLFVYITAFKICVYSIMLYIESRIFNGILSKKQLIKYILPVYINSLSGIVSSRTDKYIVSNLFTKSTFAFYSTGAFELPFIGRFINGIFHSRNVRIKQLIQNKKYNELKYEIKNLLLYLFPFIGIIIIFTSINAKLLIDILYSSKYTDSYIFFFTLLLISPIRIIPFGFLLNIYGKTKQLMYLGIFDALITINFILWFIPIFGPIGGIFAFMIATVLQVCFMIYLLNKFFPIKFFLIQFAIIFFLCNIGFIINEYNNFNIFNNVIIILYIIIVFIIKKRSE